MTSDDEILITEDFGHECDDKASASTLGGSESGPKRVSQVFQERMEAYKTKLMPTLSPQDQAEFKNPQHLSEFSQDIFVNLKNEEDSKMVPANYLQHVQTEIKDTSRAFLIEWIIDVHRKFRLTSQALYVAVFIIDQYLSKKHLAKTQLHLLGVATLLISSKYEEIYPPTLQDFLTVSENKFTKQTVLKMEKDILTTLNFEITAPTALDFLRRYKTLSATCDDEVYFFAQYL